MMYINNWLFLRDPKGQEVFWINDKKLRESLNYANEKLSETIPSYKNKTIKAHLLRIITTL